MTRRFGTTLSLLGFIWLVFGQGCSGMIDRIRTESVEGRRAGEAMAADDVDVATLLVSAEKAIDAKKWQTADADLTAYLDAGGLRTDKARYLRGVARLELKRWAEAKADLETVVRDYPGSVWEDKAYQALQKLPSSATVSPATPPAKAAKSQPEAPATHAVAVPAATVAATPSSIEEPSADESAVHAYQDLCQAWRQADGSQRAGHAAALDAFLDGGLSLPTLRSLARRLPSEAELAAPVVLKWALLAFHQGYFDEARQALAVFMKNYASHPLHARATELVRRLDALSTPTAHSIGVILPLTGSYAGVGAALKDAVILGARYIEGQAGDVTVVLCDDGGSPEGAAACVDRLVIEDRVLALVGPVGSDSSESAAVRAQWWGVPLIALSQRDGLPQIGDYIFRMALTPKAQAEAVANYATKTLGLKTFAILYPRDPYGQVMMQHFWRTVTANGGKVTAIESYPNESTDFTEIIQNMVGRRYPHLRSEYGTFARESKEKTSDSFQRRKATEQFMKNMPAIVDFEAVFIPDYARAVSMVVPFLAREGIDFYSSKKGRQWTLQQRGQKEGRQINTVRLMGASGWNSPRLVERTGAFVEEAVFCDGFYPGSDDETSKAFVDDYQQHFSRVPTVLEAYAFDAMSLLYRLFTSTGADTPPPATRDGVKTRLHNVKDAPGATGPLSFDPDGDLTPHLKMLSIYSGVVVPADQVNPKEQPEVNVAP